MISFLLCFPEIGILSALNAKDIPWCSTRRYQGGNAVEKRRAKKRHLTSWVMSVIIETAAVLCLIVFLDHAVRGFFLSEIRLDQKCSSVRPCCLVTLY